MRACTGVRRVAAVALLLAGVPACEGGREAAPLASKARPAAVPAAVPAPVPAAKPFEQVGTASWYGSWHRGRKTASGEPFDPTALTAAHRSLPFDSVVRVTNLENGKSVRVTITDRGPFRGNHVIDLSARAADVIGMRDDGLAPVRIELVEPTNEAVTAVAD